MKKSILAIVAAVGLFLALSGGEALAVADGHASCEGLGVSAAAPGQDLETVHDAAGIVAFFAHERKADGEILGLTPGAITSADAQKHLGSPESCFSE